MNNTRNINATKDNSILTVIFMIFIIIGVTQTMGLQAFVGEDIIQKPVEKNYSLRTHPDSFSYDKD